ncbi:MAG TPA: sigma-70 family RNA polymerase sigma factor, partial [Polyangiaceae bacterium]|nr:sigma-70 family RNA polymerase sigma factor [Polyangiaceae bacterium]
MKPTTSPLTSSASPTREELTTFLPLVHRVVARMLRRLPPNVLRDDLVAAGSYGLVDALRKSPDRGPAFEWYARVRIRGAVVDELRSQDWLTRRARTRTTQAHAEGTQGGTSVVGFDDLPDAQAQGLCDESAATPQDQVERRMERAALERAVALLPEREASIVAWHYFEDVPFKTIAARLGVSEPRVSQLHSRAMGMLKSKLAADA